MSSVWIAPLVVLGLGLTAGLLLAWRSADRFPAAQRGDDLRRRDLQTALAESLQSLRDAGDDHDDREALELRAALLMRDLENLPDDHQPLEAAALQRATGANKTGRPMLLGALFGGGLVALVAVLIGLAVRDAKPQPAAMGSEPSSAAPMSGAERGEPALPPFVAAEIASLRDQLQAEPADQATRRELAGLLLAHDQYFDAFGEAQTLLAADPTDPEGNYVSAVVRYTMGQAEAALEHLQTTIRAHPEHVGSWLVKGLIELQLGDREAAVLSWQSGLEAAGGSEPRLDHLLRLAKENRSAEEILSTPPPAQ